MFTPEEIAGLQRTLDETTRRLSANLQTEVAGMLERGELGKSHPDLEPPVQDGSAYDSASGFSQTPVEVASPVGLEAPRGNQPDVLPAASSQAPQVPGRKGRRIYIENPDGTALSNEAWDARNAQAAAERAAKGEPSQEEALAAYKAGLEAQKLADDELLSGMDPDLLEASLKRHGRDGLLAIIKGEAELEPYTGPDGGNLMFTHASTGESMTPGEVQERMDIVDARRIGKTSAGLAHEATAQMPFSESIINTPEGGIAYVEQGHLSDGLDMKITINSDGSLGEVAVIVSGSETGEAHTVAVEGPEADAPQVRIDGEPATPEQAPVVEAVLQELASDLQLTSETPADDGAIVSHEAEPQSGEALVSDVAVESPAQSENAPVFTPETQPAAEVAEANQPTQEQELPVSENQPEGASANQPEQPAPDRPRAQPRTPEEIRLSRQKGAMNFMLPYARSNPSFLGVFKELGIDPRKLVASDVQLTPETLRYIGLIQKLGVRSNSGILQEPPNPNTPLGRAAIESQKLVKGLICSMFQKAEPEQ